MPPEKGMQKNYRPILNATEARLLSRTDATFQSAWAILSLHVENKQLMES